MKQLLDSTSARRKRNAARDGSVGGGGVGAEGPATDDGFAGAFALVPLQVSRVVVAWFWSESEAAGVWRRRCVMKLLRCDPPARARGGWVGGWLRWPPHYVGTAALRTSTSIRRGGAS